MTTNGELASFMLVNQRAYNRFNAIRPTFIVSCSTKVLVVAISERVTIPQRSGIFEIHFQ
jgi:hypothetical protein